jgi:hypothetical protein
MRGYSSWGVSCGCWRAFFHGITSSAADVRHRGCASVSHRPRAASNPGPGVPAGSLPSSYREEVPRLRRNVLLLVTAASFFGVMGAASAQAPPAVFPHQHFIVKASDGTNMPVGPDVCANSEAAQGFRLPPEHPLRDANPERLPEPEQPGWLHRRYGVPVAHTLSLTPFRGGWGGLGRNRAPAEQADLLGLVLEPDVPQPAM